MEFDTLYAFREKDLKKEVKNFMMPYQFSLDFVLVKSLELVDGKRNIIKLTYENKVVMITFPNILECWKFYNYATILHFNAAEWNNSLDKIIRINMRVLLDDLRQKSMKNVILVLIDNYNKKWKMKKLKML